MLLPFTYHIFMESIEGGQASSSRTPGVDINAIGTFEGNAIYDVDLDSFEDKPWRKPGII